MIVLEQIILFNVSFQCWIYELCVDMAINYIEIASENIKLPNVGNLTNSDTKKIKNIKLKLNCNIKVYQSKYFTIQSIQYNFQAYSNKFITHLSPYILFYHKIINPQLKNQNKQSIIISILNQLKYRLAQPSIANQLKTLIYYRIMLIKLTKRLQNITTKQLITDQKIICNTIIKIYKFFLNDPQSTNLCQLKLTQIITQKIYGTIKIAIQQNIIKEQQVQYYQFLFARKLLKNLFHQEKLFKLNTNLEYLTLQKNDRNINTILCNFQNDKMKITPASLKQNCQASYFNWNVNKMQQQKIFIFRNEQLQDNQKLQRYMMNSLCSLFNNASKGAALMMGITQKYKIKGIKITNQKINKLIEITKYVRNKYIFPPIQKQQIFQINIIRISSQFENKYTNKDSLLQYIDYVIKIYVNTHELNQTYFVVKQIKQINKLKYQYYLYKDPKKQPTLMVKIYIQIHNYYKLNKNIKYKQNIKIDFKDIQNQNYILGSKMIKVQQQQKQDKLMYGRIPDKYYSYHSLVIVSLKGEQMFKKFLSNFENQDTYRFYEVYEKLNSVSKRKIYYLTHRRNQEQLSKIADSIDKNKSNLIFLKIKSQITLLRHELFGKAYKALKQKYEKYFNQKLSIVYKRDPINPVTLEYYFIFNSDEKAIFSLVLLQASDIRCNFANPSKIKGCISLQVLLKQFPKFLEYE